MSRIKKHYPLQYTGNIFILIVCAIIFFPVALVLALKNLRILRGKKYQSLSYRGSYGWLIFWTIVFFPIALILLIINGIDMVEWDAANNATVTGGKVTIERDYRG